MKRLGFFPLNAVAVLLLIASTAGAATESEHGDCGLYLVTPRTTEARRTRPSYDTTEYFRNKTHVRVHYTLYGIHATTVAWAESAAVAAETAWVRVQRLGWAVPPPDQGAGGDDRFDIYVRNLGSGVFGVAFDDSAYTDPYPDGYSSWAEIARDSIDQPFPKWGRLKALVAHEFHHCCQMRYSDFEEPKWAYYENTSVWIEDILFPGFGTLYWRNNNPTYYTDNPLLTPWLQILATTSTYEYPGGLWPKFLAEYYGSSTPRLTWQLMGAHAGSHMLLDIDSVLNTNYNGTLDNALGHYAIWRYFTGDRDDNRHFYDAQRCTTAVLHAQHSSYPVSGNEGIHDPIGPGGMDLIEFTTNGTQNLTIDFNGQDDYAWRAYVIGIRGSVTYEHRIPLAAITNMGSITIPAWEITSAILIPVVTNWVDGGSGTPALTFTYSATVTNADPSGIDEYADRPVFLADIHPNPLAGHAVITWELPQDQSGVLQILDVAGRSVRTFNLTGTGQKVQSGWALNDQAGHAVPSGVYFIRLSGAGTVIQRKIVVR